MALGVLVRNLWSILEGDANWLLHQTGIPISFIEETLR